MALEPDSAAGEVGSTQPAEWISLTETNRGRMERQARRLYKSGRGAAMRDTLLSKTLALASGDPLWKGLLASDRDIVVIVPRPVLQTLCNRIARTYLQGAKLDIHPNLREHLDELIRVKLLGGKVGAGRIEGDVRVSHLEDSSMTGDRSPALPPDSAEIRGR